MLENGQNPSSQPVGAKYAETARNVLLDVLNYARHAPSGHNTQPWRFAISQDAITVFANEKKRLHYVDPAGREFFVSLGAIVKTIKLVSNAFGLKFNIEYPDLNGDDVAKFKYQELDKFDHYDKNNASLIAILKRHNNRFKFDGSPLNVEFESWVNRKSSPEREIFLVTDKQKMSRISKQIDSSLRKAFREKGFSDEMADWTRPSYPSYRDGLPGYNLNLPFAVSFMAPWVIRHFYMGGLQARLYKTMLSSSSAFLCICSKEDDRKNWLASGELMQEIWVKAQEYGIKLGIMAASIETGDDHKRLMEILATKSRPQVFMRLGYSEKIPRPAPRLNLEELLIEK